MRVHICICIYICTWIHIYLYLSVCIYICKDIWCRTIPGLFARGCNLENCPCEQGALFAWTKWDSAEHRAPRISNLTQRIQPHWTRPQVFSELCVQRTCVVFRCHGSRAVIDLTGAMRTTKSQEPKQKSNRQARVTYSPGSGLSSTLASFAARPQHLKSQAPSNPLIPSNARLSIEKLSNRNTPGRARRQLERSHTLGPCKMRPEPGQTIVIPDPELRFTLVYAELRPVSVCSQH